jgi:hypothetical protein
MNNVWLKRVALTLLGAGGGFVHGALTGIVLTMNTERKDGR